MASAGGAGASASSTGVGITVPDDVKAEFSKMRLRRAHRWMTFRIDQDTFTLQVAAKGDDKSSVAAFLKALPDGDARYGVYDQLVANKYGGSSTKLFLFMWSPPSAGRQNVLYAAQRRAIDSFFTGINVDKQVSKKSDIESTLGVSKDDDEGDWDPDA